MLYERINGNGNGKLTETENVISYVTTEFLRMNVILTYFCCKEHGDTVTDQRKRNAGNQV